MHSNLASACVAFGILYCCPVESEPRKRRWWRRLLLVAGLITVAIVLMVFGFQRRLLFPRHLTETQPQAANLVEGLEEVWIESDQGPVEGWLIPGGATAEAPGPAVVFAHGNAELIDYWPIEMAPYRKLGVTVLLAEFRGYGRSAGSPSQERITSDLVAFHDILAARPDVDPERIVFHGRSMGGGAVCALAVERRPAALILQSTYTSLPNMARRFFVPGFLILDRFDNEATLRSYDGPVLIVHGQQDTLIPFSEAEALRSASAGPSELVPLTGGHNDCSQTRIFEEIERFFVDNSLI